MLYQGQHICMTNIRLRSIDQYMDVSSRTNYYTYHLKDDESRRLKRIHFSSRDSARTPMQWDGTKYAGFSDHKPWFYVNPNYKRINVAKQQFEPDSILNYYRRCIKLRSQSRTLLYGSYREYAAGHPYVYLYERRLDNISYLILCSFAKEPLPFLLPKKFRHHKAELVLTNCPSKYKEGESIILPEGGFLLSPYEALVYRMKYR